MGGMRMISVAIEHTLGSPEAVAIMERWLDTTLTLFPFRSLNSPFAGYVVRYDAASSDDWMTEIDAAGTETPIRPCNFAANPDPRTAKDHPWLDCIPLDDSRYARGGDNVARDRWRHQEPSIDEYAGLVVGYIRIFDALKPDADASADGPARVTARRIIDKVKQQTRLVAAYLQAFAYILVRPCGNVTFRGAAETNPCMEFPFSRAFEHILGDGFGVTATFEDAMTAAGLFDRLFGGAQIDLSTLPSPRLPAWVNANLPPQILQRAALIARHAAAFDVEDTDSAAGNFALGFVLTRLARPDPKSIFRAWMARGDAIPHSYKTLLALVADSTGDAVLRDTWFDYFDHRMPHLAPDQPANGGFVLESSPAERALPTAVSLLLSRPPPVSLPVSPPGSSANATVRLRGELLQQLNQMAARIDEHFVASPLISNDDDGLMSSPLEESGGCCDAEGTPPLPIAFEYADKVGSWHGFLAAVAVAWLHARRTALLLPWTQMTAPGQSQVAGWRAVTIPADVVARIGPGRLPVPGVFLAGRPPGHDVPLLDAQAPAKPPVAETGRPEPPHGQVFPVDQSGAALRVTRTVRFPAPQPPVAGQGYRDTHHLVLQAHETSSAKASLLGAPRLDGDAIVLQIAMRSAALDLPLGRVAHWNGEVIASWLPIE
jgi:hypothetical protein